MTNGITIDSFAGGGGASLGIAWATGRAPDIAINHDAAALAMHEANHPSTEHVREDVWHTDFRQLVAGRHVDLLWLSPDCKHFSRAKGSVPVDKSIRSLAWVAVRWASQERPDVIILENVREFADWGPLLPRWVCRCGWKGTEGQAILKRARRRCPRCDSLKIKITDELMPDPAKKGFTFRLFVNRLRGLGYEVAWRTLNAADYGAPTHRRRLFLVARCDGASIEWPEPTHGDPKKLDDQPMFARLKPWRTAAECIDWSIPCPSIFDRKRPLADKTLRRIAMGIKRYVLDSAEPFIVSVAHTGTTGRGTYEDSLGEPFKTVTQSNDKAVIVPTIVGVGGRAGQSPPTSGDAPLGTCTAKADKAIVTPYIVPITHAGERRIHSVDEPVPTVTTAHRGEHAVVAPVLTKYHGQKGDESRCRPTDEPFNTLDTQNRYGLVSAFLAKHFGGVVGVPIDTPLPTTTTIATQNQVTVANLVRMNHGEKQWNDPREPLVTVTSQGNKNAIVASNLIRFNHDDAGVDIAAPLPTQTTYGHAALVYSFLVKYFGTAIGANLWEPAPTATGKDRFGLVTVTIAGELYIIVDIGMRMLSPRELARAQGFPDTYVLTGTKTNQVAKIGNSVSPEVSAALVRANVGSEVRA